MRARLIPRPGRRGTKKFCAGGYEGRLLDVRYRYDEERRKRFKTVELLVDEIGWEPRHRATLQGQGRGQPLESGETVVGAGA